MMTIRLWHLLPLALLFLMLPACGDAGPEISLERLTQEQAARDGETVVVEGVVASHDDPRHFWIEDDDFNRVGLEPEGRVADHVGERVRVRGAFSYSPDTGRSIRIEELTRVAEID